MIRAARAAWRGLLGDVHAPSAVVLLYAAVVLSLTEYLFLPSVAARTRIPALMGSWAPPDLASGLTWAASTWTFFLILPAVAVRACGRSLASIGWSTRGLGRHLGVYALLYAGMTPLLYVASKRPDFVALYPFVPSARLELRWFVVWEAAYLLQFLALEAFFRGALLFTLAERFGRTAIFVAVVPYVMIHFHKPLPECLGAAVAGTVLGALALRFRSFLGGALLHGAVGLTMDLLATRRAGGI
ncbi:MAG TPA: CPBP family intramembrane glutamic endopeptidase [Planctomycetota bacterium]|nr:CPBP family intramembrane glutamic endopeptidase [Planctomycetota bacterium]